MVPLFISWPEKYASGMRTEVVSLVDIAPTLAQIAGFSDQDYVDNYLDGDSLCGLLEGNQPDWKDLAVVEYLGSGTIEPMLLARQGKYKYVYVHNQPSCLFDLEADPKEENNLAGDPDLAELQEKLHQIATGGKDVEQLKKQVMTDQRRRLLVQKSMNCGKAPSW